MGSRALNKLSAKKVTSIVIAGYHSDGGGLYLRVKPTGSKSWVLVSTKGGKRVERGIGGTGDVTLARAREMRDMAPADLEKALNPHAVNDTAAGPPLFGDFADAYIDGQKAGWKCSRHATIWKNSLDQHAEALSKIRVDMIATDDVVAVLRPIWMKTQETASRVRGRIERILDAAAAAGHRDSDKRNPATWGGHLEHFLPKQTKKSLRGHHSAVPWRDMPAFWAKLAKRRSSSSVSAMRFTILTAARTGEVIGARRREFEDIEPRWGIKLGERVRINTPTWIVPGERMKMKIEHRVPLSAAAMTVLEDMDIGDLGPEDFIFPGAKVGESLSNMAMLMLMRDELGRDETVHGFRSSFRDWAGEATDFPRELAELALAHAIGDATEQAYRRERAVEKRRPLMDDWAGYLSGA